MKLLLQAWISVVIVLSIYSFLYNENKIYRIVLNICIGIGTGYTLIVTWKQVLGPLWWDKFCGLIPNYKSSSWIGSFIKCVADNPGTFILFLSLGLLGSLWYFQTSRKYMWLSRIVIGITVGANGGIIFKQQLLPNVPQIIDSARPLISGAHSSIWPNGQPFLGGGVPFDFWQSISNIIFLVGVISVMVYFLFSFDHSNPVVKRTAGVGRWLLMILFGGFFGNTIMTRMSILLQNIEFLKDKWWPAKIPFLWNWQSGYVGLGLIGIGSLIYFTIWRLGSGKPGKPTMTESDDETPSPVSASA